MAVLPLADRRGVVVVGVPGVPAHIARKRGATQPE